MIKTQLLKLRLPAPVNLRYFWNLGSLLGIFMAIQIARGFLLTFYYFPRFESVWTIHQDRFRGRIIQWIHLNTSSLIFLILYLHFIKAIIYGRFSTNRTVFLRGWVIMVIVIAIRFLGYVLPWGQMSLWGATVIINLIRVIRSSLVVWLWGGFRVRTLTVKFFYRVHFILPFVLLVLIGGHIMALHVNGSNARVNKLVKIQFFPFYLWKDAVSLSVIILMYAQVLQTPYAVSDPENFSPANPAISPLHIKPEWYFLQYYAILRAIPNKLGGVIFFVLALLLIPALRIKKRLFKLEGYPVWWLGVAAWARVNCLLIGLGACPVEVPFVELRQLLTVLYFTWFLLF